MALQAFLFGHEVCEGDKGRVINADMDMLALATSASIRLGGIDTFNRDKHALFRTQL